MSRHYHLVKQLVNAVSIDTEHLVKQLPVVIIAVSRHRTFVPQLSKPRCCMHLQRFGFWLIIGKLLYGAFPFPGPVASGLCSALVSMQGLVDYNYLINGFTDLSMEVKFTKDYRTLESNFQNLFHT